MVGQSVCVTFDTDFGWVGILASARGLLANTLPLPSEEAVRHAIAPDVTRSKDRLADTVERFRRYYGGHRVLFEDELDLSGATPFQRQVWTISQRIPYGETRSYLWVAEQLGRPQAARAVGQAMGRNPLSIIIPCHRVVTSDGQLGGFGGGLDMKRRLLRLESPDEQPQMRK